MGNTNGEKEESIGIGIAKPPSIGEAKDNDEEHNLEPFVHETRPAKKFEAREEQFNFIPFIFERND